MPARTVPRSVTDATRFTASTPHASSKTAADHLTTPGPSGTPKAAPATGGSTTGNGNPTPLETPEQRVARLRAAHRRAAEARISKFDRIVDGGRRLFDSAHKVAVMGIISFTVIAGLVTVYTAADMMVYNRKRKAEFLEAQRRLEADSLEAARLAYMTGKATDEQIALVEEALEREAGAAPAGSIFARLPPGLGPPQTLHDSGSNQQRVTEAAAWPSQSPSATPEHQQQQQQQQQQAAAEGSKEGGLWAWMTSSLKKEDDGYGPVKSQRQHGYEGDGSGTEGKQTYLRQKAHEAFEREKGNQREGGPLDRVGLDAAATTEKAKKKGWLW